MDQRKLPLLFLGLMGLAGAFLFGDWIQGQTNDTRAENFNPVMTMSAGANELVMMSSSSSSLAGIPASTADTRYLSNTGTNHAPQWDQVNLANGVAGDLPLTNLAQGTALSVLGVAGNATADEASIVAGSDGNVLRRSGTTLGFGALNLASANATTGDLPFSSVAQGTALSVLGVTGNATADVASISAASDGQVLRRSGTALTFGALDLASANATTGDLPYASLVQGSALSVLGVTGNATADVASIAAASDGQVLRRSGTAVAFGAINLASANAITGTLPAANLPTLPSVSTTFSCSATGFSANPSGTCRVTAMGSMRMVQIPLLTGTSNATTFTIGTLDIADRPARRQQSLHCQVTNLGLDAVGSVNVETSGSMTVNNGLLGALFAITGTKAIQGCTLAYTID